MLIIADMDGTLTESRQKIKKDMLDTVCKIMKKHFFCIISGAIYERIKKQVLDEMPIVPDMKNLYIVAQSGAEIRNYMGMLCKKTMDENSKTLVKMLLRSFASPCEEKLKKYGIKINATNPIIIDKGSQITFSIVGVNTDVEIKKQIDSDISIRKRIVARLRPFLPPNINMVIGGTTSIDFTPEKISKRSGVQYVQKYLGIGIKNIIYIGDKCFKGGNDWIGEEYDYRNVSDPIETLEILRGLV